MKKTYISPNSLTVQMRPFSAILTTSTFGLDSTEGNKLGSSEEILVKEAGTSDVNVWDNEW